MIDIHADGGLGLRAQLVLRPNRALSARQLRSVFFALAAVAAGTSLASWTQGNAFAPLFALLHLGVLAACLALAWRGGERSEVIALGDDRVEVWRGPVGETTVAGHPQWVRVTVSGDGRLWLGSHGKRVEVGGFLGEAERGQLAVQLNQMLAGLRQDGHWRTN